MIFNLLQRIVSGIYRLNEDTFNSSQSNLINLYVIADKNILNTKGCTV